MVASDDTPAYRPYHRFLLVAELTVACGDRHCLRPAAVRVELPVRLAEAVQ